MKNFRIIIVLSIVCLMSVSCYESDDKYVAGKEMTITGIESVYNKTAIVDKLHIEPQITTTDPNAELQYTWRIWLDYSTATEVPKKVIIDTISNERILDYLVVERPQTYRVELKVTNKTTGQEAYAFTTLNVTNEFSKGFYVMKDTGNSADLDLHAPDGTVMADIIAKIEGEPMPGTPTSFSIFPKFSYDDDKLMNQVTTTLNIATENGFRVIDIADLKPIRDLETMFYFPGDKGRPLFSTFIFYGAIYISDVGIFYSPYDLEWGSLQGTGYFGNAAPLAGGYKLNIHIVSERYYSYFFDELNGRFLTISPNADLYACSDQDDKGNTLEISPNNISNKMLYFGRNKIGTNTDTGFSVMQHPTDPTKRYLYEMTLRGMRTNPMLWKREITELNFNQATLFANNERQSRALYYTTGTKVYRYLIDDLKEDEVTLEGFGAGEQITYLQNIYWTGAAIREDRFNYLAVGTQNGENYKIYLYKLVAGVPVGAPVRILEGAGKALKMHYITPEFTINIGDYQYPIGY